MGPQCSQHSKEQSFKSATLSMEQPNAKARKRQSFQSIVQERITILSTLVLEAGEFPWWITNHHPLCRFHARQEMFWIRYGSTYNLLHYHHLPDSSINRCKLIKPLFWAINQFVSSVKLCPFSNHTLGL